MTSLKRGEWEALRPDIFLPALGEAASAGSTTWVLVRGAGVLRPSLPRYEYRPFLLFLSAETLQNSYFVGLVGTWP